MGLTMRAAGFRNPDDNTSPTNTHTHRHTDPPRALTTSAQHHGLFVTSSNLQTGSISSRRELGSEENVKRSCFSSPFKRQQFLALRTNVISCVCVFVVVVVFNMILFPVWGMFAPLGVYLIKTDSDFTSSCFLSMKRLLRK